MLPKRPEHYTLMAAWNRLYPFSDIEKEQAKAAEVGAPYNTLYFGPRRGKKENPVTTDTMPKPQFLFMLRDILSLWAEWEQAEEDKQP